MPGLKIYEINANYVKYLSVYQNHLFFSDGDKAGRKYIEAGNWTQNRRPCR